MSGDGDGERGYWTRPAIYLPTTCAFVLKISDSKFAVLLKGYDALHGWGRAMARSAQARSAQDWSLGRRLGRMFPLCITPKAVTFVKTQNSRATARSRAPQLELFWARVTVGRAVSFLCSPTLFSRTGPTLPRRIEVSWAVRCVLNLLKA